MSVAPKIRAVKGCMVTAAKLQLYKVGTASSEDHTMLNPAAAAKVSCRDGWGTSVQPTCEPFMASGGYPGALDDMVTLTHVRTWPGVAAVITTSARGFMPMLWLKVRDSCTQLVTVGDGNTVAPCKDGGQHDGAARVPLGQLKHVTGHAFCLGEVEPAPHQNPAAHWLTRPVGAATVPLPQK